jgi:hypothetical protein
MQTESERLVRLGHFRAKERERNQAAGVPDMDPGDRHEPCEWFAQVGFFAILDRIGRADPDYDWSEDGGEEAEHEAYLAARRSDHQRVADWLRGVEVSPIPNHDGADIGGIRCYWPDRIPGLKSWSGNQTLAILSRKRQAALPAVVTDVLECEAPITGASGIDRCSATTALEDGFSVDALGMKRMARVGMELLAIIGLETLPITVHPDQSLSYEVDGVRYAFRAEPRGDYGYRRWGSAERVPETE